MKPLSPEELEKAAEEDVRLDRQARWAQHWRDLRTAILWILAVFGAATLLANVWNTFLVTPR